MPRFSYQLPLRNEAGQVTGHTRVCGSSPQRVLRLKHCAFCGEPDAAFECDFPIGGVDERGLKKTCDKLLCIGCRVRQGRFDYCPDHKS